MFTVFLVLMILLLRDCKARIQDDTETSSPLFAELGDNVTLKCFYSSGTSYLSWYKQIAGEKPQQVSYYYKYAPNEFYDQFKNDSRFSVGTGEGSYHLKISNAQESDSAMYYCGETNINVVEFGRGTFLIFKDSNGRSFLEQPVSESFQPGDSVTLNCTVHTETCDGEHTSVYWFRHSGESQPGIIYTHGARNGRCQRSLGAAYPKQSCVYSLSKRNLTSSDAGTYYCAVASCGEILFGNGTRVEVGRNQNGHLALLCCVGAALILSFVLNIVLACILYRMSRRICLQYGVMYPQASAPTYTSDNQDEDADRLQYVALSFKRKAVARTQKSTEEKETIYSGLRHQNLD